MKQKKCEACGEWFSCCADQIRQCHCYSVQLSQSQKEELQKKFKDCLCEKCLKEFSSIPAK